MNWRIVGLDFVFCFLFCCVPSVQLILGEWSWWWKSPIIFIVVFTSLASAIKIDKLLKDRHK